MNTLRLTAMISGQNNKRQGNDEERMDTPPLTAASRTRRLVTLGSALSCP